jgi:hypothetical protein
MEDKLVSSVSCREYRARCPTIHIPYAVLYVRKRHARCSLLERHLARSESQIHSRHSNHSYSSLSTRAHDSRSVLSSRSIVLRRGVGYGILLCTHHPSRGRIRLTYGVVFVQLTESMFSVRAEHSSIPFEQLYISPRQHHALVSQHRPT